MQQLLGNGRARNPRRWTRGCICWCLFVLLVFVDIIVVSIDVEQPKQFVERLMLGKFNSTWGDLRTRQFKGSVSNIQVFTYFDFLIQALFSTYSVSLGV